MIKPLYKLSSKIQHQSLQEYWMGFRAETMTEVTWGKSRGCGNWAGKHSERWESERAQIPGRICPDARSSSQVISWTFLLFLSRQRFPQLISMLLFFSLIKFSPQHTGSHTHIMLFGSTSWLMWDSWLEENPRTVLIPEVRAYPALQLAFKIRAQAKKRAFKRDRLLNLHL